MPVRAAQLHVNLLANISKFAKGMDDGIKKLKGFKGAAAETAKILGALGALKGIELIGKKVEGWAKSLITLAQQDSKLQGLKDTFLSLGGSLDWIDKAKESVNGIIGSGALLAEANKLMIAGLKPTGDQFVQLTEYAARYARANGIDVVEALDKVGTAIAKGGGKFTALLGFHTTGSSKAEHQAQMLSQLKDLVNGLPPIPKDVATSAANLSNAYAGVVKTAAAGANTSETFRLALIDMSEALKGVDLAELTRGFAELVGFVVGTTAEIIKMTEALWDWIDPAKVASSIDYLKKGNYASAIRKELGGTAGQAADEAYSLMLSGKATAEVYGQVEERIKTIENLLAEAKARDVGNWYNPVNAPQMENAISDLKTELAGLKAVGAETERQNKAREEATAQQQARRKVIQDQIKADEEAAKKAAEAEKAQKEAQEKLKSATEEATDALQRETGEDGYQALVDQIVEAKQALEDGSITQEEYSQQLDHIYESLGKNVKLLKQFKPALADANQEMAEAERQAKRTQEQLKRLAEDGAENVVDAFSSTMGINLPGSISKAIQDGLADAFPETMTQMSGSTGEMYLLAFQAMVNGIEGGIDAQRAARDAGYKTGDDIAEATLEGMGEGIFGTIGAGRLGKWSAKYDVGGQSANFLLSHVSGLFGTNNADHAFRQGVSEWFSEAFDGKKIKLIIEGELKELDGIDMGKYVGLDKLDGQIQETFGGLGEAISQLLKDNDNWFEGIGDQIGSAIMNATGGNLLALRVLLSQLELSAEDLEDALAKSFMAGDTSAAQFLSNLKGVKNAFGDGIPDKIGATADALQEFFDTALTSGAYASQSLADLGQEWKELDDQSLDGLKKSLLASGKTAEEVDAIITSLQEHGIDNPDELLALTPEQVAEIVTRCQELNAPFKDVAETVDDLNEKLNELENREIDTYVNVHVSYPDGDLPEGSETTSTEVPAYANGGLVTKPTLALVGEAGREWIIPEKNINRNLGSIAAQTRGGDGAYTLNIDARGAGPGVGAEITRAIRALRPGIVAEAVNHVADNIQRGRWR